MATPTPKQVNQAVVIIHGIGEQIPMATVRGFVETVWEKDPDIGDGGSHVWNKPSSHDGSFEQRRLTTNKTDTRSDRTLIPRRTDFFEYYWAHHTVGTKWSHLRGWITSLLFRPPWAYPKGMRHVWVFFWALTILVLMSVDNVPSPGAVHDKITGGWAYLVADGAPTLARLCYVAKQALALALANWKAIMAILAAAASGPFVAYLGDVARYVQAKPANIKVRHAIRDGGIRMLEHLMRSKRDYDRIIIVAHSLGSIVAYDLLTHLWARHSGLGDGALATPEGKKLVKELDTLAAKDSWTEDDRQQYRAAQAALGHLIKETSQTADGLRWRISDFVTLGSPLTHAEFLISPNKKAFERKKQDREYPTCPPVAEYNPKLKRKSFTYASPASGDWHMNHASLFAFVRWTNIYDRHRAIFFGDLVSGPVAKAFAPPGRQTANPHPAIKDIRVHMLRPWTAIIRRFFTHTLYWQWRDSYETSGPPDHIRELRDSVNLRGRR